MTSQLILGCIQGAARFALLNFLRPIASTLSAVAIAALFVAVRRSDPAAVMGILLAASAVSCILGGAFIAASWQPTDASVHSTVTSTALLRYGLASLAGAGAPLESLSIDQAAVGLLLTREQLGLYAVGGSFANLSSILVAGIGMVALPRIAGSPTHEGRRALMRRTAILAVAAAACAALFESHSRLASSVSVRLGLCRRGDGSAHIDFFSLRGSPSVCGASWSSSFKLLDGPGTPA